MLVYGSYIGDEENLPLLGGLVTVVDISIAVLAGFLVLPAMYVALHNGVEIFNEAGALISEDTLIFTVLPELFATMGMAGIVVSFVFFMLMSIAALTSSISMLEVPVAYTIEEHGISRKVASTAIGTAIAAFSTVSGIGELNNSFDGFAQSMQSDQALSGSALVGRSVLVPSSLGNLAVDGNIEGQINVPGGVSDLKVQIFTESGVPVRTLAIGPASGYANFNWDGSDDDGQALPAGVYQYRASGTVAGDNTIFATATVAKVDSVLVGNGSQGLTINLAGIGSVPFSEVQEII